MHIHTQPDTHTYIHTYSRKHTHAHQSPTQIHITISKLPVSLKNSPSESLPPSPLPFAWLSPDSPLLCDHTIVTHFEQNNPNCIILQLMMMYMAQSLLTNFSIRHIKK